MASSGIHSGIYLERPMKSLIPFIALTLAFALNLARAESLSGQKISELLSNPEVASCLSALEKRVGQPLVISKADRIFKNNSVITALEMATQASSAKVGTLTVYETVDFSPEENKLIGHAGRGLRTTCYISQ